MRPTILISLLLLLYTACLFSQSMPEQPPATPASERLKSEQQRLLLGKNSILNEVKFRSVGPTVFSGRVTDLAVDPADPTHFYAAYASGGLWETKSNGTRFTPLFEEAATMTIGDIAVNWSENIIWIGTGENNSSRSSYSGVGIYKSTDGGETWIHRGLPESHHIGRIILHPTNPDILWVAVLGHLYSPNKERGVYKTTDGGSTWEKTLFVDENSGAIDLTIDSENPDVLYASTWHRERRAWNFVESGEGSLIHKSTDGGKTWSVISGPNSGFPNGEGAGRIGLALTKTSSGKTRLYAIVDNYFRRPKSDKDEDEKELTKEKFREMDKASFLKLEEKPLKKFLKDNGFPKKYSVEKVRKMVESGKIKPVALTEYLENANSLLFDTPVIGAEVYVSDDEGKSWKKTHEDYLDRVYNSYGYYFGQIRVSPRNADHIYIYGVPILRSLDGGKNWENINGRNVHVDHHAMWVSPDRDGHLIIGNDGGVNISYDNGDSWYKCNSLPVGQFYAIAVDNAKPYNIYGGLQDNGVWVGPSTYESNDGWHNSGKYGYDFLLGGDGMQVEVDPRDNNTVYTGFQFGFYFRIDRAKKERKMIQPRHELGERPLRFNWQTPIHLSIHQPDILYLGSNFLHRSFKQGDDFQKISEDLTKGGRKGDVAFGTITDIHESPLEFGLLYVGTDDGLIHVSRDGGHSWTDISRGLPDDFWVTTVEASSHELGTVYATLNGYRWDDFTAYVYRSTDFGENWQRIGLDLPLEPVNVIREDPNNKDIVYVGTDHGLYTSLNGGLDFMQMRNGMPAVSVHDLVIHPREQDLVVGTHGRSIYVGSVKEVQQIDESMISKSIHVFEMDKVRHSGRWGNDGGWFSDDRVPKEEIPIYVQKAGKVTVTVETEKGLELQSFSTEVKKGLNYVNYDLSIGKGKEKSYASFLNTDKEDEVELKPADNDMIFLQPGVYTVKVKKDGTTESTKLEVE